MVTAQLVEQGLRYEGLLPSDQPTPRSDAPREAIAPSVPLFDDKPAETATGKLSELLDPETKLLLDKIKALKMLGLFDT